LKTLRIPYALNKEAEGQFKELALSQAEQETQRADKLAAKLRELNIDPDTI
jgi:hypothetical protein